MISAILAPCSAFIWPKLKPEILLYLKRLSLIVTLYFTFLYCLKYVNTFVKQNQRLLDVSPDGLLVHIDGKIVLRKVSMEMKSCLLERHFISWYGGDEFVVVLEDTSPSKAEEAAKNIISIFSESLTEGEYKIDITQGIGISTYPMDCSDEETLMKYANTAMYEVKYSGKNNYKFYRSIGVKFTIDDFGAGYSSLSVLQKVDINNLKMDMSFARNMMENHKAASMVKAIIDIGKNLNCTVTAEGIETKEQLQFLKDNNCDIGQGYFFSKPLSAARFGELLKNWKRR